MARGKRKNPGKGSVYERAACRRLSLWVTGLRSDEVFWRAATSGAKATVRSRSGGTTKQAGDIAAVDPAGQPLLDRFVVECKHYKDLGLKPTLYGYCGEKSDILGTFWTKVSGQALARGREPMMLVRENMKPDLMILSSSGSKLLMPEDGSTLRQGRAPVCLFSVWPINAHAYLLGEVLNEVSWSKVVARGSRRKIERVRL